MQELEESRRLYSSQKRALKEALNAAAEKEANEVAADEASRTAVAQAVEDEMEQLHHQLALTKVCGGGRQAGCEPPSQPPAKGRLCGPCQLLWMKKKGCEQLS